MADAENAKPSEDDGALLAVEASEPVTLQEPERFPEPETQATAEPSTTLARKPAKQKNGLLGFILGGAIVAGSGFGVAKYVFPQTDAANAIAALQTQLDAKATEDAALRSDVAALAARPATAAPDAALVDRIAVLEQSAANSPDTAAIEARLTALEDRLTSIEAASVSGEGAPAVALAAMDREIKALRSAMDAQKGAGSALAADVEAATAATQARLDAAETAALSAAKQAALSHVRAAFESGAPLGPALEGLKAMSVNIPETLVKSTEGLPTLLTLQDGFAEPARTALAASIRAEMGDGWADRLTGFLRSQSGARSLTPREGTDPDAVLSRAEAALRSGDLKSSLAELAGLPPDGTQAMADWVVDATRRLDAEQAITDLSATLSGQ